MKATIEILSSQGARPIDNTPSTPPGDVGGIQWPDVSHPSLEDADDAVKPFLESLWTVATSTGQLNEQETAVLERVIAIYVASVNEFRLRVLGEGWIECRVIAVATERNYVEFLRATYPDMTESERLVKASADLRAAPWREFLEAQERLDQRDPRRGATEWRPWWQRFHEYGLRP